MGVHLLPLLAAGAVGAYVVNQTNKEDSLLHNTAVNITAGALNIKDTIEDNYNSLIEEAEAKNNSEMVDIEIE